MKKITALKNKETGMNYYLDDSFGTDFSTEKYTVTPCLLIEEAELREKIEQIKNRIISTMVKTELSTMEGNYHARSKIIELLNSLTK